MVLFLNTASSDKITLGLAYPDQASEVERFLGPRESTRLLAHLDKFLKDRGVRKSSLQAIVVCNGPGRFSGVRAGVVVANTLGLSLKIPVTAVPADQWEEAFEKNSAVPRRKFHPVMPYYDKEPNITTAKK